jgi:hypothetical protein
MGLGNKAPSALNLELPGAGHVTRFAASAECVVDFELRSQQGGVSRKRHAFFAWAPPPTFRSSFPFTHHVVMYGLDPAISGPAADARIKSAHAARLRQPFRS